jgi:DNA polymerase III subunit beta
MSVQITERPAPPIPTPLPDVIRITVKAQYDSEDWFTFNAEKTAAEVPAALRDRYPHLAAVTLDESGDWLRVIERLSFDSPLVRYRIYGMDAGCIDMDSSEDDWQHVRLVRLGCDDPGPETAPTKPTEEPQPVIATETPADTELVDEATKERYRRDYAAEEAERALAAASVPPKRSRKAPVAAPPAPGALAVTVAREPLRAALRTVVTAAASGRLIAPVTANVLIEADSAGLRLTCTDLSQRLSTHLGPPVQIGVDSTGASTVPAKLLSQLVDTFTAPDVTLRQDGAVLRVTSGKSRGHLKGIDAAEFPGDRQDGGDTWRLPAAVLRRALALAAWAAARDESRPALRCVCLAAAGGTLVAQAADGTALSSWAVPLAGLPACTALVPREAAETMARLLAACEGNVTLSLLPSAAQPNVLRLALGASSAHGPEVVLSTRTSEGQYPDLMRVVPKTHTLAITVQRAALLGAVRQAGVVADRVPGREGFRPSVLVNLRAEPGADGAEPGVGALHVWSTNASVGEQRMEIAASITSGGGGSPPFKLDGTYLVELLGALDEALDGESAEADDGAVTLRLTKASNPVRFGCTALPEWIGVVMPMFSGEA